MEWTTKLYQDLEFDKVRKHVAMHAQTNSAQQMLESLTISSKPEAIKQRLLEVHEYQVSLVTIPIPSLQSEEILTEIKLLGIAGSVLDPEQFSKLKHLSEQVNRLIAFFDEENELYPTIQETLSDVYITTAVIDPIQLVIDQKGVVRNNASQALQSIRRRISEVRKQIEVNFMREMAKYRGAGFLDDTRETFLHGKRVLAVMAEHKRKVSGSIVGASNGGKLAFIEPGANVPLNNELSMLELEEKEEIRRILLELTDALREHLPLLRAYQSRLVALDFIAAKAHYANELNATLPKFSKSSTLNLMEAYHPILLLQNKSAKQPTYPQHVTLDPEARVMVISGPNAGGKSITLKTIGLLQVMFQSGLLIPVKSESQLPFFTQILTDIGDNQSIENHLSTYSYRLQNMKRFLEMADGNTLFLIDEFGTGSDPELGGALAEVFFETLYERGSYGVLTTHYSNIKLLADHMPMAINANMLFDRKSLLPKFKLSVGQPGSSFTFEVAEKNGISRDIINKAKSRIDNGKLRLDESISALQREKGALERHRHQLKSARKRAENAEENFEIRRENLEEKLNRLQQTQQENNELILYGNRLKQWLDAYTGKNHKKLAQKFVDYLKIQFTKKEEQSSSKSKAKTTPAVKPINYEQKKAHKAKKKQVKEQRPIVVGDQVRMKGSKESGKVLTIDKKQVTISFGVFKTKTTLDKIELTTSS